MHPWLLKLCAIAVQGMKLLPFHEEMNGAFIPRLWPKHLDGFRPSRLFLIAGKIDHPGTLMQPFYLERKYKILCPWKEEESDNRRHFLCMQFQSFQPALYPEALHQLFSQGRSCRVYLVLPGFERRLPLPDHRGAHSGSKHCPPPCIFKAQHFSVGRNLECISFSSRFALLPSFLGWLLLFQLPASVPEFVCFSYKRISNERQRQTHWGHKFLPEPCVWMSLRLDTQHVSLCWLHIYCQWWGTGICDGTGVRWDSHCPGDVFTICSTYH